MNPKLNNQGISWDLSNYRFWLNAYVVLRPEDLQDQYEADEEDGDDDETPELQLCPDSSDWEKQYEVEDVGVVLRCPFLMPPMPATKFGRKRGNKHVVGCA